jgi:hypothetical protein
MPVMVRRRNMIPIEWARDGPTAGLRQSGKSF